MSCSAWDFKATHVPGMRFLRQLWLLIPRVGGQAAIWEIMWGFLHGMGIWQVNKHNMWQCWFIMSKDAGQALTMLIIREGSTTVGLENGGNGHNYVRNMKCGNYRAQATSKTTLLSFTIECHMWRTIGNQRHGYHKLCTLLSSNSIWHSEHNVTFDEKSAHIFSIESP